MSLKMETAHPIEWEKLKEESQENHYVYGILSFAERWACLMEDGMASGNELEAVADSAADEADTEGITGYMYNVAVRFLVTYWKHGEALRRWHNRRYGVSDDAEGVVNACLFTMSVN